MHIANSDEGTRCVFHDSKGVGPNNFHPVHKSRGVALVLSLCEKRVQRHPTRGLGSMHRTLAQRCGRTTAGFC